MPHFAQLTKRLVPRRRFLGGLGRLGAVAAGWLTGTCAGGFYLSQEITEWKRGSSPGEAPFPSESADSSVGQEATNSSTTSRARLREGTPLAGVSGTVRRTGDRYTFFGTDSQIRLVILENLFLERIVRAEQGCVGSVVWQIWGVVTEFRGENYLLIQRATIQRIELTPQGSDKAPRKSD